MTNPQPLTLGRIYDHAFYGFRQPSHGEHPETYKVVRHDFACKSVEQAAIAAHLAAEGEEEHSPETSTAMAKALMAELDKATELPRTNRYQIVNRCNSIVKAVLAASGRDKLVEDWISVEEKLPTKRGLYLVTYSNGICMAEFIPAHESHAIKGEWLEAYWGRHDDTITHWMPVPPPALSHAQGKSVAEGKE